MKVNSAMDRVRKAIFGEPIILESKEDMESPEEVVQRFHDNATRAVAQRYSRGSVRLQAGRFNKGPQDIDKKLR